MTDFTPTEFNALDESVKVLSGNLDQLFLLVMGCCIFCEYAFFIEVTLLLR